jgi:hypothetical protein
VSRWPEDAYRRAVAHWRACYTCAKAGGEKADKKDLCQIGRLLGEQWERAERVEAEMETRG